MIRNRVSLSSLLVALAFCMVSGVAAQEDSGAVGQPDTSAWRCRLCPFTDYSPGYLALGAGYVDEDSDGFGDYRGLDERGLFPVLNADLRYFQEDADFFDLRVSETGLDSRSVSARAGRQGRYRVRFAASELPHYPDQDASTVFRGLDSGTLILPNGWVRADNTADMTALAPSLRETRLEQHRESLALGFDFFAEKHWRYRLDYQRDTREGQREFGGSFLFRSALLPMPVDDITEKMDASVGYVRQYWQMEAAYHSSLFTNENDALVWDNPFTSSNGAGRGRAAPAPDNQFHQLLVSGSWRNRGTTTVAGRLAVGRMEQDEAFLPSTINAGLSVPALPEEDLNGRVNTRTANLRVTTRPISDLGVRFELAHDERDNETPRNSWTQVATDEIVSDARLNRPYSHEKNKASVVFDYRLSGAVELSAAGEREEKERTFQETEENVTRSYWIGLHARLSPGVDVRARETLEQRSGSHHSLGLLPPEHPGLRKYHLAERERHARRLRIGMMATEKLSVGLAVETRDDDYTESEAGLTQAQESSLSLDLGYSLPRGITANAWLSFGDSEAEIRGADNLDGAPWQARQQDLYQTLGAGVMVDDLPGAFGEAGMDLTWATGTTELDMDKAGVSASPFPDIKTRLYTLNLYAERHLAENSDLRLEYLLEGFREEDFHRDGVAPDTIPTVLALGGGTPGYSVQALRLAWRYRF